MELVIFGVIVPVVALLVAFAISGGPDKSPWSDDDWL